MSREEMWSTHEIVSYGVCILNLPSICDLSELHVGESVVVSRHFCFQETPFSLLRIRLTFFKRLDEAFLNDTADLLHGNDRTQCSLCFLAEQQHTRRRCLLIMEVFKSVLTWPSETKITHHVCFSAFFSFLGALRLILSLVCHPRYSLVSGISCSLLPTLPGVSKSGIREKKMNDMRSKINLCFPSFSFLSASEVKEKVGEEDIITSSSSICSERH